MIKVRDIAGVIESYAPPALQESYDNSGLQVGDPDMDVTAVLLCLDVTESVVEEAVKRRCNMIVSHHPLIFGGLKQLVGRTATQRIVASAIRLNIAIYSAHTNLDAAANGVSHEMASALGMTGLEVLEPNASCQSLGLGLIGEVAPTPTLEFLRKVKETFNVKGLRYSVESPQIVVKRVALCGGSGASLIKHAVAGKADIYITGDIKYHDFTTYGENIILADIGHYESELGARKIFSRIIREKYPECVTYFSESEQNPIGIM